MTRELKPYRVDEVSTPQGSADVMFDRTKKIFFVRVGVERVEHPLLAECIKMGRALLESAARYEWEPIIFVHVQVLDEENVHVGSRKGDQHVAEISLHFWRCERSPHPGDDERYLIRTHTEDFAAEVKNWMSRNESKFAARMVQERDVNHPNAYDVEWHSSREERALPYADETWRALQHIESMMVEMSKRLDLLLRTPDFARGVLATTNVLALPAPRGRIPRPRRGT